MASLVWGFSSSKRIPEDRLHAAKGFQTLVLKLANCLRSLRLKTSLRGTAVWIDISVDYTLLLDGGILWPRNCRAREVLKQSWSMFFAAKDEVVSSHFEQPSVSDFITLAMAPSNKTGQNA